MANLSDRSKIIYLFILILFLAGFGLFWMDYIGLVDIQSRINKFQSEPELVVDAADDEPSLIEREEFEKERQKLQERVEELDKRELLVAEAEKNLESSQEKLEEVENGLKLEKKKFEDEKKKYSGYIKNVKDLANKIANMPPEESVKILEKWEDPLIIDVLRQMDAEAANAGKVSITSYLMTLMAKEKASRIMYLMTQL
ncbi:MAG: hypothetical protein GY754_15155 [bacterium]|nr:hypothetical protein [bacterium]